MADAIIENSPKKLVVDPLSKKDVEALIKEILGGVKKQTYTKPIPKYNESEGYSYITKEVGLELLEAIKRGDIITTGEAYYCNVPTSINYRSDDGEIDYATIQFYMSYTQGDDGPILDSLEYWLMSYQPKNEIFIIESMDI